jgi:hypothetical protein
MAVDNDGVETTHSAGPSEISSLPAGNCSAGMN